jgi:AcrR family transcriptional regulator
MSAKETTRERLLDAAEQVFADKGFHEAAVDEVVRRSNTSKGAVYFHFPSKEELFNAVMESLGQRLIRRVEQALAPVKDPVARLDVALVTTLDTFCRHKGLAKLLLLRGYGMGPGFARKRQEVFARFAALIQGLLEDALKERPGHAINTQVAAYAWLGAVSELLVYWLEGGGPHPLRQGLSTLRAMLLQSIGLGAGPPSLMAAPIPEAEAVPRG